MTRAIGQHSCATPEWGSPLRLVELARTVLGHVDVDPASSPHWNRAIGAARIITRREGGLRTPWVAGAPAPDRLAAKRTLARRGPATALVNPPGDPRGELVAGFWSALARYYELGWITSAIWIGFSVEQLARLQRVDAPSHPLEHATLVPSRRLHYQRKLGVPGDAPGHASYVTLLSSSREELSRFRRAAAPLGCVVEGSRWR